MKEFTSSLGFVVFFLVMTMMIHMIFGDGPTLMFLTLVLLSMLVVNADKITAFIGRYSRA